VLSVFVELFLMLENFLSCFDYSLGFLQGAFCATFSLKRTI